MSHPHGPSHFHIFDSSFCNVGRDVNVHYGDVINYSSPLMHFASAPFQSPQPFPIDAFSKFVTLGAAHDAEERRPYSRCHPGTRLEILDSIRSWLTAGEPRVCWLHGPAGAGKSAIAQTVSETYAAAASLGGSFFFSRSGADRSAMKYLFPTIAVQLAMTSHEVRCALEQTLHEEPSVCQRNGGGVELIERILLSAAISPPLLVVIDGLDECKGSEEQQLVLQHIQELVSKSWHFPLRFLVVSRPEPQIRSMFEGDGIMKSISKSISLYGDIQAEDDVRKYLEGEFSRIHDSERHSDIMRFVPKPWPSPSILEDLARKSAGYFIYAATIIKYVDEEFYSCLDRLEDILGVPGSHTSAFAELDKLYLQILSSCRNPGCLKLILGFNVFQNLAPYRPAISEIEAILNLRQGEVGLTLRGLHSVLRFVPGKAGSYVSAFHASFGDFLLDKSRSQGYFIDPDDWQQKILRHIMSSVGTFHEREDKSITAIPVMTCVRHLVLRWFGERPAPGRLKKVAPALLKIIRESMAAYAWDKCILASETLPDDRKYGVLHFLAGILGKLLQPEMQHLDPHDTIHQINQLCDLFYHTRLSNLGLTHSAEAIRLLQDMFTLQSTSSLTWEDDCRRLLDLPQSLPTACYDFREFESQLSSQPSSRLNFWHFMNNPKRSLHLYCHPFLRNASLAASCMRRLCASERDDSNLYERFTWVHHLVNSIPGNQQLVYYLERLEALPNFNYAKADLHDVLTIIDWLERSDTVQIQLVLKLEAIAVEFENQNKFGDLVDRDVRMQEVFGRIQERRRGAGYTTFLGEYPYQASLFPVGSPLEATVSDHLATFQACSICTTSQLG